MGILSCVSEARGTSLGQQLAHTPSHRPLLLGQAHPTDVICWVWQPSLLPDDQSQCMAALEFPSQSATPGAPSSPKGNVLVPLAFGEIKATRSTVSCFWLLIYWGH